MAAAYFELHAYDRKYRLFDNRTIVFCFDIDAIGPEAWAQDMKLDAMLHNLARLAHREEGVEPADVRLELVDRDTGRKVYDWMGR